MLVGKSEAGVCCIAVFLGKGDEDENTWEFVCSDGNTDCGGNYGGTASGSSSGECGAGLVAGVESGERVCESGSGAI